MTDFKLRNDEYGQNFYLQKDGKTVLIPYQNGDFSYNGISFSVSESESDGVLKISVSVSSKEKIAVECFGLRLGIDCYMDTFPQWNDKFFPTALRCEKNGFWSCFMSPKGKIISVCSPSKIVSWKNEYKGLPNDVGHRIYTSSIDFINTAKQPARHPDNSMNEISEQPLNYDIYYSYVDDVDSLFKFVEKYANIHIPKISKFTLEKGEKLTIDSTEYENELSDGLNIIKNENSAEVSVYVRNDWFYYLDCAQKSAQKCQQKPGTHCESWYGYFTMAEYAKVIQDSEYVKKLCKQFDKFFATVTRGFFRKRMKRKTLPHRLQNSSAMISLLSDFYQLTSDKKYLDYANDLAKWLMHLQSKKDGSYRSHGTHYTCVIYPAKSMLELSIAEKAAGLEKRSKIHFESAQRAIDNLYAQMDNIETEGEMTFEDGMISCESLQLAYLAMLTKDERKKKTIQKPLKHSSKSIAVLNSRSSPTAKQEAVHLGSGKQDMM